MTTEQTPRFYWEDFPVGHQVQRGGMPVSREAVLEFARQFDPQPFHVDVLSLRMEVLEARPMASKPHVGLVKSRWEMRNQHGEPVLTMEGWGMFRRRDGASTAS